jgi:hypothetical protein
VGPFELIDIPGGASGVLTRRWRSTEGGQEVELWSLAIRTVLVDDAMYEAGLAVLGWLGRRSHENGFIALAREELSLVPAWTFVAFDGWTYMVADGNVGPDR